MDLDDTRRYWDDQAESFDAEPDHGLGDPATREAWRRLLLRHLPAEPADVADLGCGTGTLSVLLAQAGHEVVGVDLSHRMVALAQEKAAAAGVSAVFHQGDAAEPALAPGSFDVVLVRHVLWALPDPVAAVERWTRLLRPGGRLVAVEGRWHTGAGIGADECVSILRRHREVALIEPLEDPVYWGGPIEDERYLVVSPR